MVAGLLYFGKNMAQPSHARRIIRALSSLKLAVVTVLYLAVVTAIGTIVESRFDANAARKLVYDTPWMYVGMFMLSVSLIAVMVDRWPWKARHTSFVLAHIGILILLFGSILTMKYGLDGQLSIPIGGQGRQVVLPYDTDILVYASFGGEGMAKLHEQGVDFFRNPPTAEEPLRIKTNDGEIEISDYRPYVLPSRTVVPATEAAAGSALRFQIRNDRVNVIEWLVQRNAGSLATHDFGPAKLHLGTPATIGGDVNEIYLTPRPDGKLDWVLFRKGQPHATKSGVVAEGGLIQPGWMGLEIRVLRFHEKAREEWELKDREAPTPLTTSAVKVKFQGREQWLLLNDTLRLFTSNVGYLVSYLNRRVDLGFQVQLKNFEMIPYQGTQRAMEYRSVVEFPGTGDVPISMNEPGVHEGLTFYQASFQNDEMGRPTHSVFSVNYDPGRFWKYLGSLVMSLGIIALFWFRKRPKTAGQEPGRTS